LDQQLLTRISSIFSLTFGLIAVKTFLRVVVVDVIVVMAVVVVVLVVIILVVIVVV